MLLHVGLAVRESHTQTTRRRCAGCAEVGIRITSCQRFQQQAGIHKLVGKERVCFVVEDRAQLHRSGRGVDLVVDGLQLPGRHLGLVCARSNASTGSGFPCASASAPGPDCLPEW